MIINNSYLNLLNTLSLPSNDTDIDKTSDSDKSSATNSTNNLPVNMDSADISSSTVTEVEAEVIQNSDDEIEWEYNTTDDGYLPDFKLGDWENTSQILFGGSTMQVDEQTYAVYLPQSLQDKMAEDPEFAKEINDKLNSFFESAKQSTGTLDDGTEYSVISQYVAVSMNENGDIVHSYVRTESYSVNTNNNNNILGEPANDEDITNGSEIQASFSVSYGFSIYQQSSISSNKELSDEEKNSQAMIQIGVQSVITIETAQVSGSEPEIKIRKVNGDLVELETGKLIQKHAGFLNSQQKYDSKA